MKKIIIGFSKPKKFKIFAWIIMKLWNRPYDHVYCKFHSDTYQRDIIYQASKTMVNFMGTNVFLEENIIYKEFNLNINDVQYIELMQFAIDNAGLLYGIIPAIGLGIQQLVWDLLQKYIKNPFANGEKGWFCSKLITFIVENFTTVNFSKPIDLTSPRDLLELLEKLPV